VLYDRPFVPVDAHMPDEVLTGMLGVGPLILLFEPAIPGDAY